MFEDLPWQIDVLLFETVFSLVAGITYLYVFRFYQRSWKTALFFGAWDVALLTLLVTGGSRSWQHLLVLLWYVIDLTVVMSMGFKNKRHDIKPGQEVSGAIAGFIFSAFIFVFLLTGVRS